MARLLPFSPLLLGVAAAHAQQPVAFPVAIEADSSTTTRLVRTSCPADSTSTTSHPFAGFTTILPALSRVAGVQVTPYSGAPGAWATVRIRGAANAANNAQPLYVVDGVPVYNTEVMPERWPTGSTPGVTVIFGTPHTAVANPLLDLPVEDVAQVEVLQGAAATARYGQQGGDGVILISTRRGADGGAAPQRPRVRYAGWGGVQQVRQRYELLDAPQYAGLANAAAANGNRAAPYPPATLGNLESVDWQDRIFRTAGIQSHHLSVDGLAGRTRYYVAANYLRQTGVVQGSDLSRYQLHVNLDQQLTTRLRLGLKANASQTDQRYSGDFDAGTVLRNVLLSPPLASLSPGNRPNNPLAFLDQSYHSPRTRRLLTQLDATYQFSPALGLSVRGSREQVEARELGYSVYDYRNASNELSETSTGTARVRSWVADAALRYQRTFAARHALTATLAYQYQKFERDWGVHAYSAYQQSTIDLSEKSLGIHSPSATVGYSYAGRYEVQAALRSDFVRATEYGPLRNYWSPGGQLSWHLHKEAWLANATALSDLTLWAGTGRTGTFVASGAFFASAPPARTTQHDAGLRLGLLGGRLTLDVAAYQRRSFQSDFSFAYQGQLVGVTDCTLRNQGLTLTLGSTWQLGPLAGTSQLAAATNRNEVESQSASNFLGLELQPLEAGQPLSRFLVFTQEGIYPAGSARAGQVRYRDQNNDGSPEASYQGTGLPRHTLSFFQQLLLKRFQLEAQVDGLFGYQLLNPTLAQLDSPTGSTNSTPRALDYWTPAQPNTTVPRAGTISFPFTGQYSDQALASGNHVRLTQLTFSYAVLHTATRNISLWVGGQNLFVTGSYRGFDPNVSSGGAAPLQAGLDASAYPVARIWQLGVRGQF